MSQIADVPVNNLANLISNSLTSLPTRGASHYSQKNFIVKYNPEHNRRNIYERKLNQNVPSQDNMHSQNPLTKLMQPQDIRSKRYIRDQLNISDIPGVKPDVYKKTKNIEGREYMNIQDIEGAQPLAKKQINHLIDYKLYTKDIQPDKWMSKRNVNPLNPEYDVKTKSGRMMRIGQVEKSTPSSFISPATRRQANYIGDIEGSNPKKTHAISEIQRQQISGEVKQGKSNRSRDTRLSQQGPFQSLNPSDNNHSLINHSLDYPNIINTISQDLPLTRKSSHFARFQSHYQQSNTISNHEVPTQDQLLNELQKQSLNSIPLRTSQRMMIGAQILKQSSNNPYQSLQQTIDPDLFHQQKPLQDITVESYRPPIQSGARYRLNMNQQQPQKHTMPQSNTVEQSPNRNTNPLLNQQDFLEFKESTGVLPKLDLGNSPDMKVVDCRRQQVWSKASRMNQQLNQENGNLRVSSQSRSHQQNLLGANNNNVILKQDFNARIFDKALRINQSIQIPNQAAGARQGPSGSSMIYNPISNEIVSRSVERIPPLQTSFIKSTATPYENQSSIIAHNLKTQSNRINQPQIVNDSERNMAKNMLPPTTQKQYGNFYDVKQLDQMIKDLREKKTNLL